MSVGIKNRKCKRCKKPVDRKGFLCKECYLEGIVRGMEYSRRANNQRNKDVQNMKKALYDKILKKVNKELDEEESGKKIN